MSAANGIVALRRGQSLSPKSAAAASSVSSPASCDEDQPQPWSPQRNKQSRHRILPLKLFLDFPRNIFVICLALLLLFFSVVTVSLRQLHESSSNLHAPERELTHTTIQSSDTKNLVWNNRYQIVHVVSTRFMQHQATLVHLAKARLDMFWEISLPSMSGQTNQEFIWIVRVDPELDPTIFNELLERTRNMTNLIVIRSNENPEGFRTTSSSLSHSDEIATGNQQLYESYHQAAQSHAVLETRLDADDALALDFVDRIQSDGADVFYKQHAQWMVWCIGNHLEWHQYSPWKDKADEHGSLLEWMTPHCVTPGLTWGTAAGVNRPSNVVTKHTWIHRNIPPCKVKLRHGRKLHDKCLRRIIDNVAHKPMAMRARTITSAGMLNVLMDAKPLSEEKYQQWMKTQGVLRAQLPEIFGVSELVGLKRRLEVNLHAIVADALKGQCTAGHSCKKESKNDLKQLLDTERK